VKPLILITIPKSGTYFVSEILKLLGMEQVLWDLTSERYRDYRGCDLEKLKKLHYNSAFAKEMAVREKSCPISKSVRLVKKDQFGTGHLVHNRDIEPMLRKYKVLFLKRDLRYCFLAAVRWSARHRVGFEPKVLERWVNQGSAVARVLALIEVIEESPFNRELIRRFQRMVRWDAVDHPMHMVVRYEDLMHGTYPVNLPEFLETDWKTFRHVVDDAKGQDTVTKSKVTTNLDPYLDHPTIRTFFQKWLSPLNRRLGYED